MKIILLFVLNKTLSIMMYSSKKESSASAEGTDVESEERELTQDHESKSSSSVFDLDETKPDPLEGLDEATKICFQVRKHIYIHKFML